MIVGLDTIKSVQKKQDPDIGYLAGYPVFKRN